MIIPSFKHSREGLIVLLMLCNVFSVSLSAEQERVPVGTHRCAVNLTGKYWILQLFHKTSLSGGLYLLLHKVTVLSYPHGICSLLFRVLYQKKKVLPSHHSDVFYALMHEIWVIFGSYNTAVAGHKLRVPCTALARVFLLLWKKQR